MKKTFKYNGVKYEAVRALAFELGITESECDGCELDYSKLDISKVCRHIVGCRRDNVHYIWRRVDDDKGSSNDTTAP